MMMSLCAGAQNAVGDWIIHTSFVGDQVTNVVESDKWVYYLSGGNLFRLDKETQENEALSRMNYLTDMGISQMFYNSDKDYLVVVYANSNIDVILSDGAVVNMPEIKNAVMTASKGVNYISFAPGVMYVATDFGYVVVDDGKFVVKESHVYGKKVASVARVGKMLLLATADAAYYGLASEYHEQLGSFNEASFKANSRMFPINDSTFFCMTSRTFISHMTLDAEGNAHFDTPSLYDNTTTVLQKTRDGYLLNVPSLKKCYKTDLEGGNLVAVDTVGEICSAHPDGDGTLWAGGINGLHQQGSSNYFLPNAPSMGIPFWMTYNKSSDLLYVSTPTSNGFYGDPMPTLINTYDGMKWTDVTPDGAPVEGTYWIDFMPDDPDTYFVGTWKEGVLKVVNNEIKLKYDTLNSPIVYRGSVKYGTMHPVTTIDRNGNLWVVEPRENKSTPVMVLPAAKTKLAQTTVADWITPTIRNMDSEDTKRATFLSTRYGNQDIKIFSDGRMGDPIYMWNSAGQLSLEPDQRMYSSFIDQDGQPYNWTRVVCFDEDKNGMVWMGTTEGVISFNPSQAFNESFRINHIKVPRNDGTGMADYLLDGITVNDIAVDGANRKWIATQSSGLFLVSPDGTQIIKKFNMTNSPLASNSVYQVCCNPNSNSVYVTTPAGLYEYFSDSSPAEADYSSIYAYPNPVRPDYLGDVTITGMMDNSLVKIADASGNVIRQLKSTGGMVTWDCCDQNGERVKTGVYMIVCSQASGSGKGAVAKVAVIR